MNWNVCIPMVKNSDYPTIILEIHKVSSMELKVDIGPSTQQYIPHCISFTIPFVTSVYYRPPEYHA